MEPSLRELGASFAGLVRTRIELAVVELQEQTERRKAMLVLVALAATFLLLGALLFAIFVIVLFWDTHRVAAAGGMTILYLGIGGFALLRLKQAVAETPPAFEATLAELKKDAEAMRGSNE